uniref:AB hydrolase-1 domain-containing protein n=1 Tax=Chromera velia CCMP2878 TaxID=1169474 RepID=A0A0G4FAS5_9ALVE|eukprot:Cvel_16049.t1-p1 / transcript=Cvel_16049.t1 / gene=Cvel_16049 / organism=Chromera_velia_CCMP2878 / gene_product=hypothetical protein / transcript_product=hypothetical protein / location=Cvel_scaffold1220:1612-3266(+) / protein_length=124 / sequence_SO=supercontig / SO=protein_coding / is_pseudo=false
MIRNEIGDFMLKKSFTSRKALTKEVLAGYRRPMQRPDWDVGMFEFARQYSPLGDGLNRVQARTLVVIGGDDKMISPHDKNSLSRSLITTNLQFMRIVIPKCGHLPQEERPDEFVSAVDSSLFLL